MAADEEDLSHHHDTVRLEAFSDGVIAIAITLLVIEITVPHVEGSERLASALVDQWPSYVGFILSFITIGIMWMNHHTMFKDIERCDHVLIGLNLLLLLAIAALPFSTAVLAEYLDQNDDSRTTATMVYGGAFTATAVVFNALWLYASHGRRLIDRHVSDVRVRQRTLRFIPGPVLYAGGVGLALLTPWLTLALYTAMAVLYLLPLDDPEKSS